MLSLISYATISSSADLFFGQHRLRHQEFIERQNYAVKTIGGMEFDQYDTLASKYLVYCEDGQRVLGCSRLTPTRLGSMLQDHFADLVLDHAIFSEPDTWEGTRFCVDSTLPADKRLQILRQLAVGYLECALHFEMTRIIGLMPTLILRSVFERNGIALRRLGMPKAIGDHTRIQAASIDISLAQYQNACATTGLFSPLGLIRPLEVERDVA